MSIEHKPGKRPVGPPSPPSWGELVPEGEVATVVRFILTERIVTITASDIRRWEQIAGEPEVLTITAGKELFVIEGRDLAMIRAALDLGRLCEIRPNPELANGRPGARVRSITIEPA